MRKINKYIITILISMMTILVIGNNTSIGVLFYRPFAETVKDFRNKLFNAESFESKIPTSSVKTQKVFIPSEAGYLENGDASITIDSFSLLYPTEISIEELQTSDVAKMNIEIINVTPGQKAYRFNPDGLKFLKNVKIAIPFDTLLIPQGYAKSDIQTFYFDTNFKKWRAIEKLGLDKNSDIVYSSTDHFTDYINGIVQLPESPDAATFVPTFMNEIKASSPIANMQIMAPPASNNKGDASLSYPIEIPAGRMGMQPNIMLNYSSEGSSSWVGYGWSLSLPIISVDTRWGVPKFDPEDETEVYMLNGKQLIMNASSEYVGYLPNRHYKRADDNIGPPYNTTLKSRSGESALFYERKLGSMSKIERIGNNPLTYKWIVTEANGTKHFYGTSDGFQIKSNKGISQWLIEKSVDIYGNAIHYNYVRINETLYIKEIQYTSKLVDNTIVNNPYYKVRFHTKGNRPDASTNGKYGLFQLDNQELYKIEVFAGLDLVREYYLDYINGEFKKRLLYSLKLKYNGMPEEYIHYFEYYKDVPDCGNIFGEQIPVVIPCTESIPDCGIIDTDGDFINDLCDNCPLVYNPLQEPCIQIPCYGPDTDGDGIKDACDSCPNDFNLGLDADNDGVDDACDNCNLPNPDQLDTDNDGLADACDPCKYKPYQPGGDYSDPDGDGIPTDCDNCPNHYNIDQLNSDNDSYGDVCDNCRNDDNEDQNDSDGDGFGDSCDDTPYPPNAPILYCGSRINTHENVGFFAAASTFTTGPGDNSIIFRFTPEKEPNSIDVFVNGIHKISAGNEGIMYDPTGQPSTCTNPLRLEQYSNDPVPNNADPSNPGSSFLNSVIYEISGLNGQDEVRVEVSNPFCATPNHWQLQIYCGGIPRMASQDKISNINNTHSISTKNNDNIYINNKKAVSIDSIYSGEDFINELCTITEVNTITDTLKNNATQTRGSHRLNSECNSVLSKFNYLSAITNNNVNSFKSALGSTNTIGFNLGLEIDGGIGSNPFVRGGNGTLEGGINFSADFSSSEVTSIDLNGDGLEDLVMKDGNSIKYYPHRIDRSSGSEIHSYDNIPLYLNFSSINDDNEIYHSSSYSFGQSLKLTFSDPSATIGVVLGAGLNIGWSVNDIFFTDANGDGLPDISYKGLVYFNNLDRSSGIPEFIPESQPTENMIVEGEQVEVVIPEEANLFDSEIPSYDAIKVWEAIHDGYIKISNNNLPAGYTVSIEVDNDSLFRYPGNAYIEGTCRVYFGNSENVPSQILKKYSPNVPLGCLQYIPIPSDCDDSDCLNCHVDHSCLTCVLDTILTDPLLSNSHSSIGASNSITATNFLFDSLYSNYHAANEVSLEYLNNQGFTSGNGSVFYAENRGCDEARSMTGRVLRNFGDGYPPEAILEFPVKKGQRIYFRVHSISENTEELYWDPQVEYLNYRPQHAQFNNEDKNIVGVKLHKSKYSDAFYLNSDGIALLPPANSDNMSDNVEISFDPLVIQNQRDEVKISLFLIENVEEVGSNNFSLPPALKTITIPKGTNKVVNESEFQNFNIKLIKDRARVLMFKIFASSNVDWNTINWNPIVTINMENGEKIEKIVTPNISTYKYYTSPYKISNGPSYKSFNNIMINQNNLILSLNQGSMQSAYGALSLPNDKPIGNVYFIIKNRDGVLYKNTITLTHNNLNFNNTTYRFPGSGDTNFEFELNSDGSYYSDQFISLIERNYNQFLSNSTTKRIKIATIRQDGAALFDITRNFLNLYTHQDSYSGNMYKSWGQFFYNQEMDNGPTQAYESPTGFKLINTRKKDDLPFTNDEIQKLISYFSQNSTGENLDPSTLFNVESENGIPTGISINDPVLQGIQPTVPLFLKANPHKSFYELNGARRIFHKYFGLGYDNFVSRFTYKCNTILNTFYSQFGPWPVYNEATYNTGAKSMLLYNFSHNASFSSAVGGLPFVNVGGNISIEPLNRSLTLNNYSDINGDRYPDHIRRTKNQMTNSTGGLMGSSASSVDRFPSVSTVFSVNGSLSYSGIIPNLTQPAAAPDGLSDQKKPSFIRDKSGVSLSLNLGENKSKSLGYYTDLNGDGLADYIELPSSTNGMSNVVKFNLGSSGFISWTNMLTGPEVHLSDNITKGLGLGLSYGKDNSNSLGISGGETTENLKKQIIDINGDGLQDLVISQGNTLGVFYNSGTSLFYRGADKCNMSSINMDKITKALSGSVNGTFSLNAIFPVILVNLKVGLNFTLTPISASQNVTLKSITDYNGDGYPDFVFQKNKDELYIKPSIIRRTNKLKSVTTPLGAEYVIDYQPNPTSYDMPYSKWVMTEVRLIDQSTSSIEGPNTFVKNFIYHNAKYDRREREDYGFEYVRDIDYLTPGVTSSGIYRENITKFNNVSYYLNGKITEQRIVRGNAVAISYASNSLQKDIITVDNTNTYSLTAYNYDIKKPNTNGPVWTIGSIPINNNDYDIGGDEGNGAAFALLKTKISRIYEFSNSSRQLLEQFIYDDYNRIIRYSQNGDGNSYTTSIGYNTFPLSGKHFLGIPISIAVGPTGTQGSLAYESRKRTVEQFDLNTGSVKQVRTYTGLSSYVTSIDYNTFGNVSSITYPPASNGSTLKLDYAFDSETNSYIETTNGVLYELDGSEHHFNSSAQFDKKFGNLLSITDISGNNVSYSYDNQGRLLSVLGPKDAGFPSLQFQYFIDPSPTNRSWSHTRQSNGQGNPPLESLVIANNFGVNVQTKSSISEDGQRVFVVSGVNKKDAYGRLISQYNPSVETNLAMSFNNQLSSYYTTTGYDEIDRPLISVNQEGSTTKYSYSIDLYLKTSITTQQSDMVNISSSVQQDLSGNKIILVNEDKTIYNLFDEIGQLNLTIHEDNTYTSYAYDMLGRLTQRISPNNGQTSYTYDDRSNITSIITANLANAGQSIQYSHDGLGRIITKQYPSNNGSPNINNVSYDYYPLGINGNDNNRGKLKTIKDGTGAVSFKYGNLGEIIEKSRSIVVPKTNTTSDIINLTYQYVYDTWNRLTSMSYPDGEQLSYIYDYGGDLTTINSSTDGALIANIKYDLYGNKTSCEMGNGTTTNYTYTSELQRLETSNSKDASGISFLNGIYDYDRIGNIKTFNNTAQSINSVGGPYSMSYMYDKYNRLVHSSGSHNPSNSAFILNMNYGVNHRIESKDQLHFLDGAIVEANTYSANNYMYDSAIPSRLNTIISPNGDQNFTYDLNGNQDTHAFGNGDERSMMWDENNMLKGINISDNLFQHYIYDEAGQRTLKSTGNIEQSYVNGELVIQSASLGNYTVYASGEVVIGSNRRVTKHYYYGSTRFLSKLAGDVQSFSNSSPVAPDHLALLQNIQYQDIVSLYNNFSLPSVNIQNNPPSPNDCEVNNNCPSVKYYFHTDHLGSTNFLTDENGEVYEFMLQLPFGEQMYDVRVNNGSWTTPYKYTGKELDSETGLYYYGARYYDPSLSMFYGVDPLADKYPNESPYNYVSNNPLRFTDPTGMEKDDIIIRSQDKDGNFKELARIETDMFDVTFDIDPAILSDYDMSKVDPICIDQCQFENTGLTNPQAISFNISGEAAYKVGFQGELSIIGMIGGPEKGEWGVALQGNGLIGLDASVTGSMSVYAPMKGNKDLALSDLRGMEYGVQGDAFYQAGSYFKGTAFTTSYPYMRNTYQGYSLGMSFGPLPGGASAYFGVSDFIYTSNGGWFPSFK